MNNSRIQPPPYNSCGPQSNAALFFFARRGRGKFFPQETLSRGFSSWKKMRAQENQWNFNVIKTGTPLAFNTFEDVYSF